MRITNYFVMLLKLLLVLKKAAANKWLNGTSEVVGNIKLHTERENSSTSPLLQPRSVYNNALAKYSNLNSQGNV